MSFPLWPSATALILSIPSPTWNKTEKQTKNRVDEVNSEKPQQKARSLSISSVSFKYHFVTKTQRHIFLLTVSLFRKRERKRDGKRVVCILWVRGASERRNGGEVGPLREAGGARASLLQPFRWTMSRRNPLHQDQLPRR